MSINPTRTDSVLQNPTIENLCDLQFTPYTTYTIDGRYQLTQLLGRGGQAAVFKAKDLSGENCMISTDVVLKVFVDEREMKTEVSAMQIIRKYNPNGPHLLKFLNSGEKKQLEMVYNDSHENWC